MNASDRCKKCHGATVLKMGSGVNMQIKICEDWRNPGHLNELEIKNERMRLIASNYPTSRRFA